jgi:Nuf2 family
LAAHPQLQRTTGKTEADLVASPNVLAKADSIPYGELHQEFSELLFYASLRDLFKAAGYNNFSWRDLHCPTPKRLQCQLSAIVNFLMFLEGQFQIYGELQSQVRWKRTHALV